MDKIGCIENFRVTGGLEVNSARLTLARLWSKDSPCMVRKIQNSIDMCPLDQVNILLNIMALDLWTLSEAKHGL